MYNIDFYETTAGYSDRINPDFAKAPAVAKNEENVLGLLLLYPEHQREVFEKQLITADDFYTDLNKRIFEFIGNSYRGSSGEIEDINEVFSPEEIGRITKMKLARMQLAENGPSVLSECISLLKEAMQKKTTEAVTTFDDLNKLLSAKRK